MAQGGRWRPGQGIEHGREVGNGALYPQFLMVPQGITKEHKELGCGSPVCFMQLYLHMPFPD